MVMMLFSSSFCRKESQDEKRKKTDRKDNKELVAEHYIKNIFYGRHLEPLGNL
jgi:hypothetical protein